MKLYFSFEAVTLLLVLGLPAYAGTVAKQNSFKSGAIISSSQVNSNFDQLFTEINLKETRITTLEANGANQWSLNGSSVYYNGGSVGLGTANPAERLDLNGGNISMGYEISFGANSVGDGLNSDRAANCAAGKRVIGGGCNCGFLTTWGSFPSSNTEWYCRCSAATTNGLQVAYAICSNMR